MERNSHEIKLEIKVKSGVYNDMSDTFADLLGYADYKNDWVIHDGPIWVSSMTFKRPWWW